MSDFISRQMVMDYLREQQAHVIVEKAKKQKAVPYEACKGMEAGIEAFMNFINQIPTAYDVDKVVRQIEKIMEDETIRFADQVVRKSIKIMKAGGADE